MRLYIATGESGEYDDWDSWVVGVFTTRAKAQRACQSTVKPTKLTWHYNAKGKESIANVKFSTWRSGSLRISPIEVDELAA
jgi:hypothetical protein